VRRLVLLLLASTGLLSAQEFRGSFSGAVTDAQGAGVPKAKVTATETQTGVKTAVEADASGAYTIPFLPLGEYEVRAEAPGFKVFTRKGLKLSANEHPVIDIRLDVGAISEYVEVTADAPLLVTANPSVGQVITTAEVEDIPINGRTPMMLDNLALGVVSTFEPGPVRPFDNGAPNSVSIGGAPSARNEVLLNGAPNAGFSNQMAYSPMQDAVQEVRVNLFDMDASMGHSMGGTINLITKQGTNGLHGSANLFNQTSKLDANSFFNNRGAVPRPSYHQNQWGVNGGGPVVLPKIFNGKNRVFWYFGYEGMRDSDPATSPLETGNPENFTSVPTAKERQGDFSELLTVSQRDPSDKNNYTIYDPRTGVLQGTQVKRQPFPGNVIPQDRLNPIALKYLQFFPLPNAAGRGNFNQNFVTNAIDSDGYDNELGRFDFNVTDRYRMTFDARHNFRAQNKNDFFHNPATGNYLYRMNQGAGIDNVYTISPSVFANVRLGWTRYEEHHFSPADSIDPSELGFPSSLTNAAPWRMLPYVVFSSTSVSAGARSGFEPLGYNGDGTNYSDVFQLFGQVMKIKGNHTIKAGLDGRLNQWSAYTFGNPSGTFTFNGNWTNSPADSNTTVVPPRPPFERQHRPERAEHRPIPLRRPVHARRLAREIQPDPEPRTALRPRPAGIGALQPRRELLRSYGAELDLGGRGVGVCRVIRRRRVCGLSAARRASAVQRARRTPVRERLEPERLPDVRAQREPAFRRGVDAGRTARPHCDSRGRRHADRRHPDAHAEPAGLQPVDRTHRHQRQLSHSRRDPLEPFPDGDPPADRRHQRDQHLHRARHHAL
jgi:hypothetical protein